jgi:hypothetical protein
MSFERNVLGVVRLSADRDEQRLIARAEAVKHIDTTGVFPFNGLFATQM